MITYTMGINLEYLRIVITIWREYGMLCPIIIPKDQDRRGGDGEDRTDNRHESRGDGRQDMGHSRSEASGQGNRKINQFKINTLINL